MRWFETRSAFLDGAKPKGQMLLTDHWSFSDWLFLFILPPGTPEVLSFNRLTKFARDLIGSYLLDGAKPKGQMLLTGHFIF